MKDDTHGMVTDRLAFTKTQTNVLKGVAILMMMWHHCFLSGRYQGYDISFFPLGESRVTTIAAFCKICVTVFAFISGYGLYLSYQQDGERLSTPRWMGRRLVKVLSGYWVIFVAAMVVCMAIDRSPMEFYFSQGRYGGLVKVLLDFFGLSNLFGTSNFCYTWWYMSAAVMFVVLAPLCFAGMKKYGDIAVMLVLVALPRLVGEGFPGTEHFYSFLPAFCIGGMFARHKSFDAFHNLRVGNHPRLSGVLKFAALVVLCGLAYKLSTHTRVNTYWELNYAIYPIPIILFTVEYLAKVPGLKQVLFFLGKHSANIFMIHTFIRSTYGADLVYGQSHFITVMAVLLVSALLLSMVVELVKKAVHYDAWIGRLVARI